MRPPIQTRTVEVPVIQYQRIDARFTEPVPLPVIPMEGTCEDLAQTALDLANVIAQYKARLGAINESQGEIRD